MKSLQALVLGHFKANNQNEHSPTHQWTSGLKLYRAQPCPPEGKDPALPTTSHSHQEAYISLLDSHIHQMADRRSKKNNNPTACGIKPIITVKQNEKKKKIEGYV